MLDRKLGWLVVAIGCGVLELGLPGAAQAGIGACGDIHVEAQAQCMVVPPSVSCEAMCKPLAIRAACAAQLAADCVGECPELPSVECSGECSGSCEADCDKLKAGDFDCEGACNADCSGRCGASCEAASDQAGCEASCQGSCGASCSGHCEGQPPEIDCRGSCEASCKGSCEADANFDCQLECQAEGEAKCEATVQGGCKAACKGEEGALFCDGQYVDSGDSLQDCVDALRATLDIQVSGTSEGSSECSDETGCRAEGRATATVKSDCAVIAPGHAGGARHTLFSVLLGGFAAVAWRRLRRPTQRR